jgi:hypothetical protein
MHEIGALIAIASPSYMGSWARMANQGIGAKGDPNKGWALQLMAMKYTRIRHV